MIEQLSCPINKFFFIFILTNSAVSHVHKISYSALLLISRQNIFRGPLMMAFE